MGFHFSRKPQNSEYIKINVIIRTISFQSNLEILDLSYKTDVEILVFVFEGQSPNTSIVILSRIFYSIFIYLFYFYYSFI